jgi:hypothetical protein
MNNTENFEPGARETKAQPYQGNFDPASELTGQLLRAMGWKEFDDLLNSLEGVNKGKQIQILTPEFCP